MKTVKSKKSVKRVARRTPRDCREFESELLEFINEKVGDRFTFEDAYYVMLDAIRGMLLHGEHEAAHHFAIDDLKPLIKKYNALQLDRHWEPSHRVHMQYVG